MKPVYMKKSNVIKMEISLPKPLPFQVWDVFCMRLTKLTRCSVDLHITAEKAEAELLEVSSYIERFVSRHMQLKIFHESLPVSYTHLDVYKRQRTSSIHRQKA